MIPPTSPHPLLFASDSKVARRASRFAGLVLLAGLAGTGADLPAQEAANNPAISSVSDFWNLPEADRKKSLPVAMEMLVYYYDPSWKLLYGQTGEVASYVPATGRALPIKAGQLVRLEGTVIANEGFGGETIKATILANEVLPEPRPTAGRMEDLARLNGRWVQIEGYVLSQNEPDATHVEARLWSEGRRVDLTVLMNGTEPVPQYTGAHVRVQGVYDVAVDASGGIQAIKLWTGSRSQIDLLGWMVDDQRLRLPATPVDQLASTENQPWVRVVGRVQAQEPGVSLTVRDETGQIEIRTAQPDALLPGSTVEVVGRAASAELGWTLKEPLFRRMSDAAPRQGPGGLPVRLRLAEQVLQLTPEEAGKGFPVTLRGVVTWADERAGEFYMQDVSGGVVVTRPPGMQVNFGAAVVVTGVTGRGKLRPAVAAQAIDQAGVTNLPPPRRISLEQAQAGGEDGRWVEMAGYVRQVVPSEGWTRLELTAASGEFSAYLPPDTSLKGLQGAMVRVRGVGVVQPGPNNEPGDIRVWVQSREGVLVDIPGAANPFAAEVQSIGNLRQLSAAQAPNARLRVSGVVTLHRPGRYLYMQDGETGLFVLTRETKPLAPGLAIEVAGLPGRVGNRPALREGLWREIAPRPPIVSRPVDSIAVVDPALDMRLVRLRATLRQAARVENGWRLSLEADDRVFEGELPVASEWRAPDPGSLLELTGVFVAEYDEYRQPHSFRLELRGPDDVLLLATPPWWTSRRIGYVVGGLGIVVLAVASWVVALRRRVRRQTEQIRLQLEKEARLQSELERSSRLESLGVLAGGIAHDFNNLLTAVLGNLGLAAMDKRVMGAAGDCIAEAERAARRARDVTQQLLTFAKGGDPVCRAVPLPEVVTEAANFARHGSNVRFDFDFPSNLPPGDVDAGQISRVVHNLVINAVQAMPAGGVISFTLAAADLAAGEVGTLPAGLYLRLTIADTGRGIPPEVLSRIFDPYFSTKPMAGNNGLGLATVRSIVKKHQGHIEVESRLGQGTTFRLWLPAAAPELPAAAEEARRESAHVPARILVMDDEEAIRRVASRMLALAAHEAVFSADGAGAIRAYTAAREAGRPFDLVILDLTVPGGMGGKETLQELRKIDPDIRAIAASDYSTDPIMSDPRSSGFCTSLPKPYDIPDLLRAVEEARARN